MYNNVDLFDLERFVKAQDTYDSYNIALKEIKDGWKQSHWMWYVFPQIHGLGHSSTSQKFSIKSLLEALTSSGIFSPSAFSVRSMMEGGTGFV